jgi:2,3-bisphosphoglycerate-independent phosphoglycerate mutase
MKYVVVLSDGMAGLPLENLGGKTTLEAARTPNMDSLTSTAQIGMANMVPKGMKPGSDTANLAVMGYDPRLCYSGRSPLEALSIGVPMKDTDVSFRCNLVTLSEEEPNYRDKHILDHSAGEITTAQADELIKTVSEEFKDYPLQLKFYTGTGYRHLAIMENGVAVELAAPHDNLGRVVKAYLPVVTQKNALAEKNAGDNDEEAKLIEAATALQDIMQKSYNILSKHPINIERVKKGQRPANSLWFWGAGTRPKLQSFFEKTGKKGAMISAVDLLKGIAVGTGLTPIKVEGANAGLHTNYEGKANAALNALLNDGYDFAYIHIEAPDEMGHQGLAKEKIKAIENVDEKVLGTLLKGLRESGEAFRVLVMPDHPTPIAVRTHTPDAVPYLLYDSTVSASSFVCENRILADDKQESSTNGHLKFCEKTAVDIAAKGGHFIEDGYALMDELLKEQ